MANSIVTCLSEDLILSGKADSFATDCICAVEVSHYVCVGYFCSLFYKLSLSVITVAEILSVCYYIIQAAGGDAKQLAESWRNASESLNCGNDNAVKV